MTDYGKYPPAPDQYPRNEPAQYRTAQYEPARYQGGANPYQGAPAGSSAAGPGPAPFAGGPPHRPRFGDVNPHWGWAVVAVIFFWPLGIAAVTAAGRVIPAMLDADYARAQEQSRAARRLGIIALCLCAAAFLLLFAVIVIAGANGAFDCSPDDIDC